MLRTFQKMIDACGSYGYLMKRSILASFTVAVIQGIIYAALFPYLAALTSELGFGGFSANRLWHYIIIIAALILLDGFLRFRESKIGWHIYVDAASEARLNLGKQLRTMPLEQLSRRQSGDLNMVLTSNVQDVVSIAGGLYGVVVNTIVAPTVTIVAMAFIDWRIALAMAVVFPVAVPLYRKMRANTKYENLTRSAATAETTSLIVEYTQGLAVLRSTGQVGAQSDRLTKSLANLREVQAKANKLGTMPSILMSAIVQLGIVIITGLAIYYLLGSSLALAALLMLIVVTVRFSEPLAMFANFAAMFDFMEASMLRISDLLEIEPLPIRESHSQTSADVASHTVEFHDVDFAYSTASLDPDETNGAAADAAASDEEMPLVLKQVSVVMEENTLTALVGSSGSGKTTITKLITRYADPLSGKVTIGGVDVASMTQQELMAQVSVVFQDVYLFDDTIIENIRIAKPDASSEEIFAAAEAANCHDFISQLPNGYETEVGEIGGALSGGERQRISIARAILKDAPIVILDEPTSALDSVSEVAVQQAIDTLVRDKTVIVIAHRLSTITAADNIVVLEDGEIVEQGTHSNLLSVNGRYAQLWSAQQSVRHWKLTSTSN